MNQSVLGNRRTSLSFLAGATMVLTCGAAWANEWPTKPLKVFVPYAAGGPVDTVTRMLMETVSKSLGQPVLVENKPGANTTVSTTALARAAPDGYTFGVVPAAYTTNRVLVKNLPYKPTDFATVSHMVNIPLFLYTSAATPASNVAEFVAWAHKKQPSYASTGPGSTGHLLGEMFSLSANLKGVHIGYNGSAKAMPDLMAGLVDYFFDPASGGMPQVKAGKLKVLAVSLTKRCECAPDVPTMAEAGFPDIVQSSWIGLMAPAGTPKEAVDRISKEIANAVKGQELSARLQSMGFGPVGSTPAQFQSLIESEISVYGAIARKANISLDN
ncbi:MAG: tripartite tricarboxylate transporter substrate binding protein [Acidovorax soli]|uniref:Bug family tripartite tricarboxylate transporter substrate binding protein n=1 Tax=Acidovorax soli TaxID=592050 RepID=UPI0026ED7F81|nr:tripartite tricarboxylate transporter substrate binding protein [Acidovorax soli]MCM2346986.1 tripartite tricarboxylate transporter substrate binding protein [Acidovorax soli]